MTDERWDVPSERLKRIAAAAEAPMFRACSECKQRHPRGEVCGYQVSEDGLLRASTCRCKQ